MKSVSNRKWTLLQQEPPVDARIKTWLLENGGKEDLKITNPSEAWRIKYSDATFTFHKKGTLFVTESNDGALLEAHKFIDSLVGSKFVPPTREALVGFDETGKGEVLGHVVLVGVAVPSGLYNELESVIGVADSKVKHTLGYWDELKREVDAIRTASRLAGCCKSPCLEF